MRGSAHSWVLPGGLGDRGAAIWGWGNSGCGPRPPRSPVTHIHHVDKSPQTICFVFKMSLYSLKPRTLSPFQFAAFFIFSLTSLSMRSHGSHAVRHRRRAHAALPLPPFRTARSPCAQPLFPPARAAPGAAAASPARTAWLRLRAFSNPLSPVLPALPSRRLHTAPAQRRHYHRRGGKAAAPRMRSASRSFPAARSPSRA